MTSRFMRLSFCISLLLFLHIIQCTAQVSITGPSCVIASREYQYIINGNWPDNSNMKLCIQGGILTGSDSACIEGTPFASVRIIWNDTSTNSISLSTASGNTTLNVSLTTDLNGGNIDSTVSIQIVNKDSSPASLICLEATGGTCLPLYKYNWQQSNDNLKWQDIFGATSPRFNFLVPLTQTAYFRRKVTETVSNSIEYSNVATVLVIPKSEEPQYPIY